MRSPYFTTKSKDKGICSPGVIIPQNYARSRIVLWNLGYVHRNSVNTARRHIFLLRVVILSNYIVSQAISIFSIAFTFTYSICAF